MEALKNYLYLRMIQVNLWACGIKTMSKKSLNFYRSYLSVSFWGVTPSLVLNTKPGEYVLGVWVKTEFISHSWFRGKYLPLVVPDKKRKDLNKILYVENETVFVDYGSATLSLLVVSLFVAIDKVEIDGKYE